MRVSNDQNERVAIGSVLRPINLSRQRQRQRKEEAGREKGSIAFLFLFS